MKVTVNKDNFNDEVLNSEMPVILDFYTENCIPCKSLDIILDEIEAEEPDIKIAKCNAGEEVELAAEYAILAAPTILLFKDGEEIGRKAGVYDKDEIIEDIMYY